MIVDILGYRDWAKDLEQKVNNDISRPEIVHFHDRVDGLCWRRDVITFAVGWSEIIPEDRYKYNLILVLHPSQLPNYRGGSPIQHQIIDGLRTSAVTIFKLDVNYPGIDTGPIAWQMPYSLDGDLKDVLGNISKVGARGVVGLANQFDPSSLNYGLTFIDQPEGGFTRKRRCPLQSEVIAEELNTWTAKKLHDKIRSLQDPYPNAFIRTVDGGKLFLTQARYEEPY